MSYKPDEATLIAYLYKELDETERARVEQYLASSQEARRQLAQLSEVRSLMGTLEDKEVIAPPIVIDTARSGSVFGNGLFRLVGSIAASVILILTVGWATNAHVKVSNREFTIVFGKAETPDVQIAATEPTLSKEEIQTMINTSLQESNAAVEASVKATQEKLDESLKRNLSLNSTQMNKLMREASSASQEQIQNYVASIQAENLKMVKDYFRLTSQEQKQYIEDLLVDFSKYLNQQRQNDLMIVQNRLNSIQQNTDVFKQETEQILTSLITSSNSNYGPSIKN